MVTHVREMRVSWGYHVKFGSSATNGVCINRREPPKLGSAWAPPPCGRGVDDPLEIHPSPLVILPNLVILGETVRALLRRFDPLVLLFKVTQGHQN